MKKSLSLFVFFILVISFTCLDNTKKKPKKLRKSKNHQDPAAPAAPAAPADPAAPAAPAAPADPAAAPAVPTVKADQVEPNVDLFGLNGKFDPSSNKKAVVDKFPFKISECNQFLMFDAEYIEDLSDFRKKKPGFFVINALQVSLYQDKDATKLIHNSTFDSQRKVTSLLPGAKGCISFDSGKVIADITICFKDVGHTQSLLDALEDFRKCRSGDNLLPIPPEQIKKLEQACSETTDKEINLDVNLEVRSGNKWDADREKFFQPVDIKVPGSK